VFRGQLPLRLYRLRTQPSKRTSPSHLVIEFSDQRKLVLISVPSRLFFVFKSSENHLTEAEKNVGQVGKVDQVPFFIGFVAGFEVDQVGQVRFT
jgi:hypothetical protein